VFGGYWDHGCAVRGTESLVPKLPKLIFNSTKAEKSRPLFAVVAIIAFYAYGSPRVQPLGFDLLRPLEVAMLLPTVGMCLPRRYEVLEN
jgi:hypothetical protein